MFSWLKLWWFKEKLLHGNFDARLAAAAALGKLGDARAVEPLVAALNDANDEMKRAAARALGKLGAVEPLLEAIRDKYCHVTETAVEALVGVGAVEPLLAALTDSNKRVRGAAAEALLALGWWPANAKQRVALAIARGCFDECAAEGEVALQSLLAALKDSDSDVQSGAAQALGKLGDVRAVEPLLAKLKDINSDPWRVAARALSALGEKRAVDTLAETEASWYNHSDAAVVEALINLDASVVSRVITELKYTYSDTPRGKLTARALSVEGVKLAVNILFGKTYDDTRSEPAVAEALGKLGDKPAVEPLLAMLKDGLVSNTSRKAAAGALALAGSAQRPRIRGHWEWQADPREVREAIQRARQRCEPDQHQPPERRSCIPVPNTLAGGRQTGKKRGIPFTGNQMACLPPAKKWRAGQAGKAKSQTVLGSAGGWQPFIWWPSGETA